MKQSPLEKVLSTSVCVAESSQQQSRLKRDANCQLLLLFFDCFFFFSMFIFLLSPAASSLWERPNHLTTSKVAYFKRKYAEEEDIQESLHGYLQKVTHFSSFLFYHLVIKAQRGRVIVPLHSDLPCRQRQRFYVFRLGSLLRKENLLDKQYNSRGLFSRKKKRLKLTQLLSPSVTANLPFGKRVPVNVTLTTLKVVYHTILYTAFKYSNGTMLFEA